MLKKIIFTVILIVFLAGVYAVSYTHLDVYKRQGFADDRTAESDCEMT